MSKANRLKIEAGCDYCAGPPSARVNGAFNSPLLQEAEQEGYLVLRKPLEPAKLHALLVQWSC